MLKINKKTNKIVKYSFIAGVVGFLLTFYSFNAIASEVNKDNVIKLINETRREKGLPDLVENEKLITAANEKAEDMINNDYFAHNSPSGVTPWYWIEKNNYEYFHAGENLAIHFKDAESQHSAWMKSELHKKNIMSGDYRETGVAVVSGKLNNQEATIVVQIFGSTQSTSVILTNLRKDDEFSDVVEVSSDEKMNTNDDRLKIVQSFILKDGFNDVFKDGLVMFSWLSVIILFGNLILVEIQGMIRKRIYKMAFEVRKIEYYQ